MIVSFCGWRRSSVRREWMKGRRFFGVDEVEG